MNLSRSLRTVALSATAVAVPFALGTDAANAQDLKGEIKIDGSSTVYPITEVVADAFAEVAPDVRVTVGVSGTGGGFKRFTKGETDISDASRPIKGKEIKAANEGGVNFVEVPVAYDGLTIAVNKSNDWVEKMTVDQLKQIFLADKAAKTWKDVDPSWPAQEIVMYAPGTDSGTFDYFKEVVAGKEGSIRSDMTVSEDDHVLVRGIAGDKNGIGFFGYAYYDANRDTLKAVPIVNDEGKAITPDGATIEDGTYNPFSRPLFIYVSEASLAKPEVAAFVDFYFDAGPEAAEEVGYVRLPSSVYEAGKYNVKNRRLGSQFITAEGEKVKGGLTKVFKKLEKGNAVTEIK